VTLYDATVRARTLLAEAGILPETASLDAELLARHALRWDAATWLARRGEPADDRFTREYAELIQRRQRREPVAYIRGTQEFWGRDFLVTPDVLIPRPETELIVELAMSVLRDRRDARVVDVGTGSGCLAISLALERPSLSVLAVDISPAALRVARENAARLGASARIEFIEGSLLADVAPPLDLIVCNPPYVAERDRPGLSPEVGAHEPAVALFGGGDGWREIRALLRQAAERLAPDGWLLMEMGYGQSEDLPRELSRVPELMLEEIATDLQGIPRVARIRRT
jgi:release factor glutamine methyltransferase